ncbi:MAG: hypothetical protein BGO96_10840 [Micrococcales bacterium 73-15]|uniref:DUF6049 family protein n=1 Tax=Salana multivorans TaxID=120377 RepID=UPI0009688D64|nr:DUF6049 family protein [Salana multivorans]OJX95335.1 MAG: hypothetical protein BGO96_10840 [Micrococcales bacterium 73-15]
MNGRRAGLVVAIAGLLIGLTTTQVAAAGSASPSTTATTGSPSASPTPSSSASASSPATPSTAPELEVVIADQSPAIVLPTDTLRLTLHVTNRTGAEIVDPRVTIGVQQEVPRTRAALLRWFDADAPPRARTEWRSNVTATLAPGATTTLVLEIPMSDLDFPVRFDNWGARGLEVAVSSGGISGLARTTGVFYPDDFTATPLELAAVVPATPDATELAGVLDDAVGVVAERAPTPEELAPASAVERATELLGTGADVALDPLLARVLPPADATAAGTVLALPWADADLAVLPLAGDAGRSLLEQALGRTTADFAAAPLAATTVLAWPAGPNVTPEALAAIDATGSGIGSAGVLLEGAPREVDGLLDPATSARVDVLVPDRSDDDEPRGRIPDTADGTVVPVVVGDDTLGDLLLGDLAGAGVSGALADGVAPRVLARQLTLGYTAVVAREQSEPVDLLAVVSRAEATRLDHDALTALTQHLAALGSAPWVTLTDVPALLAQPATATVDAASLVTSGVLSDDDPVSHRREDVLAAADALAAEAASLASAFPDGTGLDGLGPVLTLTGSTAWRLAGQDGSAVTEAVTGELASVANAVTVTVPSGVNLAANDGAIPVTVTNALAVPVTARIEVRPEQLLLRVDPIEDVQLEPGMSQSVRIPVEAIANGSTRVDVTVSSPGGAVLGSAAAFDVQVRAEWEGAFVGTAAAALGILLVVGLVRAVRRGRRNADGVAPDAPDPADPELAPELEGTP